MTNILKKLRDYPTKYTFSLHLSNRHITPKQEKKYALIQNSETSGYPLNTWRKTKLPYLTSTITKIQTLTQKDKTPPNTSIETIPSPHEFALDIKTTCTERKIRKFSSDSYIYFLHQNLFAPANHFDIKHLSTTSNKFSFSQFTPYSIPL